MQLAIWRDANFIIHSMTPCFNSQGKREAVTVSEQKGGCVVAKTNIDYERLVSLTQELVAIETPNPPADYSVIHLRMKELMDGLGLETQILEGFREKPNVVGLWRASDPDAPTLLLDAHMDVVDAGEGWDHPPYAAEIHDGVMWGRGTADMKQSLAIMICVIDALKKSGFEPKANIMLSATVDDETAGHWGLKYVLEEGLKSIGWPLPNFHLLLEASEWNINVAYKGRIWVRIGVGGKAAHGGSPGQGVNAIQKMMALIDALYKMERFSHPLMPADSLNVGTISGGDKVNVVADTCAAEFDYRFVGPYDTNDAIARFHEVIDNLSATDPDFRIVEFTVFEHRDPVEIAHDHPALVALSDSVLRQTGKTPTPMGALSAGNAYWSLSMGIPATMTGPGKASVIHTNKEHITLEELYQGATIVADFVTHYAG